MRTLMLWGIFGQNDIRLVRRDSILVFLVAYPLVWSLVSRWAVPALAQWLRPTFELQPYYPLIASYLLVLAPPLAYGSVIGFLLLDERDDGTMTALRVAPVPFDGYLAYRFLIPIVLGVAVVWVAVPLAGIVSISFPALTAVAQRALQNQEVSTENCSFTHLNQSGDVKASGGYISDCVLCDWRDEDD